jgi:16S rRNA (cytidine1402-2'-O)-methyltransferase
LSDLLETLGDREAVIARELTKTFETVLSGSLSDLIQRVSEDPNQQKGEFVVMVSGLQETLETVQVTADSVLDILLSELPVKQAASLAAKITGHSKNDLYDRALAQRGDK